MYNDVFMMNYLLISIYYFAKNRPMWGAFWCSMALGVKAGIILVLPALLGSVMYNHGLKMLLTCVFIIVTYQIIIALPFVLTEHTPVMHYLDLAKFTGKGRDQFANSPHYMNYLAAPPDLTIFWGFIDYETYIDFWSMTVYLKLAIPILNVYHFFIRKNCLWQCLDNLFSLKDLEFAISERSKVRKTLEIFLIGYMSGVVVMPGAHI